MKQHILVLAAVLAVVSPTSFAQSTNFVSVSASAFTGQSDGPPTGYDGNISGTSRSFHVLMFAPVNLPHGSTVTSLRCGGKAFFGRRIAFTLRRNEPQQENVDMATARTSLNGTGFEHVTANRIESGEIDNGMYNYYIVAEVENPAVTPPTRAFCSECNVGYCRVGYSFNTRPTHVGATELDGGIGN